MNCYYETVVDCIKVAPRKIQHDSCSNFSNSTCISTLPCTDRKLTDFFFNSQLSSVGDSDRQYTIILFISNIILPTIQYLIILMTERGGAIICCRILALPPPPPHYA